MAVVRERPSYVEQSHRFCSGCGHAIVNRLLAEVLTEKSLLDSNSMVIGVGCCCNISAYWGGDILQTAHGRASCTARGLKYALPDILVMSYQGEGDAYVIGLSETLNAAYSNSNITMIVINNNNFGMTGGQMSWTTLPGQHTTTSGSGRDPLATGQPIKVPEMIASSFPDVAFVARGSVHEPKQIQLTKRYLRKAIEAQLGKEGFSMVEILSPCPTNWGKSPVASLEWMDTVVVPHYPLGELRERRR